MFAVRIEKKGDFELIDFSCLECERLNNGRRISK
jgi:hypothetical protein